MRPEMAQLPASIRHKNPGAMWPGKSSKKFGAVKSAVLNDAQRNQIATFPTVVAGAAAHFDLLYRVYAGLTIGAAIAKWSGNNHTNDYLRVIERRTHWKRADYLTKGLLEDPELAIKFARTMAYHEAGREYPMTDAEWREAHALFMRVTVGGETVKVAKAKPAPAELLAAFAAVSDSEIGQKEVPGRGANPVMVRWYEDAGHPEIKSDETPNCAAAMCSWLERSGCANPKTLLARDFLEYGEPLSEPEENCIVVFWRESPNSWKGHVARAVRWTAKSITVVGANQGNQVTSETYSRDTVLGYRRPIPATRSLTEIATTPSAKRKAIGGGSILGVLLWTLWDTVTSWLAAAVDLIGHLVGVIPDTAATVQTAVGSSKAIASTFEVPLPVIVLLGIAACAVIANYKGTFKRLRNVNPWATEEPA